MPTPFVLVGLVGCNEFFINDREPVVTDPLVVTEVFEQQPLAKVDILWVVDTTQSMQGELVSLGEAGASFVDQVEGLGLAWQIGLVTMELGDDAGQLRGDPWIITPHTSDPAAAFADACVLATSPKAGEAGFAAATLALTEPLASGANRGFRRTDAGLQVVFVSDGDDDGDSSALLGDAADQAFVDLLAEEAARTGREAQAHAIVGDVPDGCVGELGQALPGEHFGSVAEATGGVLASVCEPDLDPLLAEIGSASAAWPSSFELQAVPVASTVRVAIDGARQDEGWTLAGSTIVFDEAPEARALIEVQYEPAQ